MNLMLDIVFIKQMIHRKITDRNPVERLYSERRLNLPLNAHISLTLLSMGFL